MRLLWWGKPDHDWEYDPVRIVFMRRQAYIADIEIRDPVDFIEERQHRTCTVCGLTQDKKVEMYT